MSPVEENEQASLSCAHCESARDEIVFVRLYDKDDEPEQFVLDACRAHGADLLDHLFWGLGMPL